MSEMFDDLSKILASPMPRRKAVQLALGGLAGSYVARGLGGGFLAWLLSPERAWAVPVLGLPAAPCAREGTGVPCGTGGFFCPDAGFNNCPGSNVCCPFGPAGQRLFTECCRLGGDNIACCNVSANERCCGPAPGGSRVCCDLNRCACCPGPLGPTGNATFICVPPAPMQPRIIPLSDGGSILVILITDPDGLGITGVSVVVADNATVVIPSFSPGILSLTVTATKIVPTARARVVLQVCRACGSSGFCHLGDPVLAELQIPDDGRRVRDTFAEIPKAERYVMIQNGAPGVRRAQIFLNGRREAVRWLRDGTVRTFDLGEAMLEENNVIAVVADGQPGSRMQVVIADSPFEETAKASIMAPELFVGPVDRLPGENLHWGR